MSTQAIVDRLLRDGHGDLVSKIRNRELSPHGAACLVGYFLRKPTKSAPGEDNRSRRRLYTEGKLRLYR